MNGSSEPSKPSRSRYQVEECDGERCIACGSTRNVLLHVVRGLTVNEQGRKRYPEHTIFLDGVCAGPPFYDNEALQYSLDHHDGCVRAFTLATCEQAVVVLLQGLPIDDGEWHLHINEPDLDAGLAAWVLLNHQELLAENGESLRRAMPIIRVEGAIDAHGLNAEILSGFSKERYARHKQIIDRLLAGEKRHKAKETWHRIDLVDYTRELFDAIDAEVFSAELLTQLLDTEELATAPLNHQKIAILCRSHQSIYAVEARLRDRYQKRLGLIICEHGSGRFTLRQTDPFLDKNLRDLYAALNEHDSRTGQHRGKTNAWGGSEDIGGSPRRTRSALNGEQILKIASQVYGSPRP